MVDAHRPRPAGVTPAAVAVAPIGYVLKVFPRVSETFVINEIRALEHLGEAVRIFSLHRPPEAVPHGILAELRAPVIYIEDSLPAESDVARARRRLEQLLRVPPALRAAILPRKYVRLALALALQQLAHGIGRFHAHFASRAGHVALLAARLADCPFSLTAHAKDIYHHDVDPTLLRWKISEAAFVATVTEYNRRHLAHLASNGDAAPDHIVRIYNGVDLHRFHENGRPADPPLLLGVGRLVEKKGFLDLIDACARLRARGYRFRCAIIGDGPERAALAARIESVGVGDVVSLIGTVSTERVAAALHEATLMVLPCLVARDGNVDALPTVLLEAMASARPVVSTRVSGIPEIVSDGETGLLVPPADAQALTEAIATLLDDPAQARMMGLAGRQRAAERFDLFRNVAQLQQLLHRPPARAARP